jgi:acyl carrier protein
MEAERGAQEAVVTVRSDVVPISGEDVRGSIHPDEIDQVVRGLLADIAPEADIDDLAPDAPLQDAVDFDSVDFLNLVTAIYEATGVDIPERDYPEVATLRGCVAYVASRSNS